VQQPHAARLDSGRRVGRKALQDAEVDGELDTI
jgi:hypothetical protein